jgi:hypothetical protein
MARNCGDFHFTGNVVRDFGGEGVVLENARNASVRGNVLRGFGLGALRISGGDRKTLTASGVVVSDNDISWVERWKRTYAPGLHLSGCGTEGTHNHFHDMLSSAMRIEGNDHHVVSNIVERVVTESDDQGGIDIYANPSRLREHGLCPRMSFGMSPLRWQLSQTAVRRERDFSDYSSMTAVTGK